MRVLQLGVGSVGEVTARTVASVPEVDAVVLADIDPSRPQVVAGKLPAGKAEVLQLDVHDKEALVKALAGVDLVINGLIPEVNLDVMAACLEAGTNYLDMAAAGPRDVVGTADVDEELALHDEFKKAGLTALVFFGIDPGASDVFARALYDQFDTVERLTVLDGDNSSAEGVDYAPSFSPTTMVEECLILPPHAYEDGKLIRRESLSKNFDFTFPDPVGTLKVWNVDHEESQLMPLFCGDKGLRNADFFIALDPDWANLLLAWRRLGFGHNKEIEFERRPLPAARPARLAAAEVGRPDRQDARRGVRRHAGGGHDRRQARAPLHVPDHVARRGLPEVRRAGHRLADRRAGRLRRRSCWPGARSRGTASSPRSRSTRRRSSR